MLELDENKNDMSFCLDLLRVIAAEAVCVGHALSLFKIREGGAFPYIQNLGVLWFFMISGLVIAYTLVSRSRQKSYTFVSYAVDRLARIESGLIPALIFVAVFDFFRSKYFSYPFGANYDFATFVGNLTLQQLLYVPWFGSGAPLWTLSIEFHLYMLTGAIFFILKGSDNKFFLSLIALFFFTLPYRYLFGHGSYTPGFGDGLTGLWFLGFLSAFVLGVEKVRLSARGLAIISLIAFGVFCHRADRGEEYSLILYPWLIVSFFCILAACKRTAFTAGTRLRKAVKFFADFSFTLYLIHYTILDFVSTIFVAHHAVLAAVLSVFSSNVLAIIFARNFEKKHKILAKWLLPRVQVLLTTLQNARTSVLFFVSVIFFCVSFWGYFYPTHQGLANFILSSYMSTSGVNARIAFFRIFFLDKNALISLSDISLVRNALIQYKMAHGSYPVPPGGAVFDTAGRTDWIPGLSQYLHPIPYDVRNDPRPQRSFLYLSDGTHFKLVAHGVEDCEVIQQFLPASIDPRRSCWAYGVWSEGGESL